MFRCGRDADPWFGRYRAGTLYRIGKRSEAMAERQSVCIVDRLVPGQRQKWRASAVGRRSAGQDRTGHLFRQAANSLHHSNNEMGDYLRRMKAKLGAEAGITATAHKLARIFYAVVKNQREYDQTIWGQQDQERQRRIQARIRKQARHLGFQLVPIQPSQERGNRFLKSS